MPILEKRKVYRVGDSNVLTLPPGWVNWVKRKTGKDEIEVEVLTDTILQVRPVGIDVDKENFEEVSEK